MRTLLACGCLAAARFVPFLAFFMSLIGSFLTIAVSVILPVSVHLKIFQVGGPLVAPKILIWHLATAIVLCCSVSCTLAPTASVQDS